MKLRIKVTKEILEKSKMCGKTPGGAVGQNCAIALAIRDVFPQVAVGPDKVFFSFSFCAENITTPLPFSAQCFIDEFDILPAEERVKMTPIEFEIDVPESVINTIDITEITKLLEDHPTLELV